MGMVSHSVDPWYDVVDMIHTRPKIQCVLPVIDDDDDDLYSYYSDSYVTTHQECCMGERYII